MSTERHLVDWLKARTSEQLELIMARAGIGRGGMAPRDQARLLLRHHVATNLIGYCTLPQTQALSAIAWLADRRHGPFGDDYWRADDPAGRAVPRTEVLDLLGGTDADLRTAAEATLTELAEVALVLPPHGDQVIVPGAVHLHLSDGTGLGRPAAQLISAYFNAAEIHRIAAGLGLPKAANRDTAQRGVLDLLADAERLRALLDTAPESARKWAVTIARQGSLVRTHAFQYGTAAHGYSHNGKFVFRRGGSGDPDTDWLAERGLLLPAGGADTAELPLEVAVAALGGLRAPFAPVPPQPPAGLPAAGRVEGSAQVAVTAAAGQIERLLAACAAEPLGMRKAGGVAVRDTKRVAKALGVGDDVARLWIDLCAAADLLGLHAEPVPRPKGHRGKLPEPIQTVLPTVRYDAWLSGSAAERLAPVIGAWSTLHDVPTYWPYPQQTAVALTQRINADIVSLRYATLEALAALPEGRGGGEHALPYLVARATWHRPYRVGPDGAARITATLREAELLGVVNDGALTSVGHTVLEVLRIRKGGKTRDTALIDALTRLLPPAQTTAFFQADLTAVVAGVPDPVLAALLDAAATRESEGHAVVWRFGAATVRRALDAGHDPDDLLARLAEVAQTPLPQPLEYLIKDAGRTHGRMRVVRSGCCIRSDDEALLDELTQAKALRGLGLRKIASTVLISTAGEQETLAGLRAAGYTPVLESETGTTVIEKTPRRRATGGSR